MSLDFAVDLPNISAADTRLFIVVNRLDRLLAEHNYHTLKLDGASVIHFNDSANCAIGAIKSCILDVMLEGVIVWDKLKNVMAEHGYQIDIRYPIVNHGLTVHIKTPHGVMALALIPTM